MNTTQAPLTPRTTTRWTSTHTIGDAITPASGTSMPPYRGRQCPRIRDVNAPDKLFAHAVYPLHRRLRAWPYGSRLTLLALTLLLTTFRTPAQDIRIHSHNDYLRTVPFYQAYAQQVASIEADVWAVATTDDLLVAHERSGLADTLTLDEAYIRPLVNLFKRNNGRAWRNSDKTLSLLIDLKTPVHPTLDRLANALKRYPAVFDPAVNPMAVRVIVSGVPPNEETLDNTPAFISFDGTLVDYTPAQRERIAMISLDFGNYSQWNGKGSPVAAEREKLEAAIAQVHALGKPIRFWGTPDGITAWNTFYTLGVDYINTDAPEDCAAYFRHFHKKNYMIMDDSLPPTSSKKEERIDDVAHAKRLDRTTAGFHGFRRNALQLSKDIDIYRPTYRNDGAATTVKNVILLIGDGMGLAQVCAADAVNHGLSLLQLKHVGLVNTTAEDAFTTDSAAAGSALATGKKHHNRHIAVSADGHINPSLTDLFYDNGYACGVVTLGNIADATPAAFYGHALDRDNSDAITAFLRDGKLTLLNGSGMATLTDRFDNLDLVAALQPRYTFLSSVDDIAQTDGKVICIDERMDDAATEASLPLLADATRAAVQKLAAAGRGKGFFLMVEGAKIDYAGHANSLPGSILETLSFDLAVAEALRFADSNGETLVIVTADHETGGLTLVDGNQAAGLITAHYMTDDHTPIRVPLFAYGPHAGAFGGTYENTQLFHIIKEVTGIK
ncbi:MAG: alkaline phosphatase [Prevotellaceae bacterium]|nr:alkaline phosphatase [Prevotellaceae bacterium]